MKYKVFYLPIAERDILEISDSLFGHPSRARRLLGELESKLKLLEFMPYMWPPFGLRPELRRMDLEYHLLLYLVDESQRHVKVYRVLYNKTTGAGEQVSGGGPSLRVVDLEVGKNLSDHELIEAADE